MWLTGFSHYKTMLPQATGASNYFPVEMGKYWSSWAADGENQPDKHTHTDTPSARFNPPQAHSFIVHSFILLAEAHLQIIAHFLPMSIFPTLSPSRSCNAVKVLGHWHLHQTPPQKNQSSYGITHMYGLSIKKIPSCLKPTCKLKPKSILTLSPPADNVSSLSEKISALSRHSSERTSGETYCKKIVNQSGDCHMAHRDLAEFKYVQSIEWQTLFMLKKKHVTRFFLDTVFYMSLLYYSYIPILLWNNDVAKAI